MEILSLTFLSALLAIILIDLVLAGDNALIIGLVARNLPQNDQRRVIFWGTFGAISIRAVMAIFVVYLLQIPGFLLVGGLALLWIARKLAHPQTNSNHSTNLEASSNTLTAIRTVIVADAIMGIDNVIAIGGAAQGSILLLVLGLMISVPIIVWGSHLVIRLVDRFPVVILLGSAVLVYTGMGMILCEPLIVEFLKSMPAVSITLYVLAATVCLSPFISNWLSGELRKLPVAICILLVWLLGFEIFEYKWNIDIDYMDIVTLKDAVWSFVRMMGWLLILVLWCWAHQKWQNSQIRFTSSLT